MVCIAGLIRWFGADIIPAEGNPATKKPATAGFFV
jgi:hypothetical protein